MYDMNVPGLDHEEDKALRDMLRQLARVQYKNSVLSVYYDAHRPFKNLGISVPPQMQNTRAALAWPSKGVLGLSRKHVFEGFTLNGDTDPFEINELLTRNRFELELIQTITSAYKHACAFITTTPGDTTAGEPDVLVQARSAEWTTALWDKRRREIKALLAVINTDSAKQITEFVILLPGKIITAVKTSGAWTIDRRPTRAQRVLAEMLAYDPQLDRPFGRSRITREVRYLTDAAIRTLVRTETTAEFFAAPQRWALNVDPTAFDKDRWSAIIGRLLAISADEDGNTPQVGQFAQMSMEPHLSMYRQLAQNFCAATNLPQSAVGIYADNPASAEAMQAAEAALSDEADYQWRMFKPALARIAQNVVLVRDELSEPPSEAWKIGVKYQPARYVSPQAAADFTVKAVGAIPKIGQTTEALRGLGYSKETIEEMQSELRRGQASDAIAGLMQDTQDTEPATITPLPADVDRQADPDILKKQFDALGVAVRAGIDPQDAAQRLGLDGIKFTGAVPVSLRMPESEAKELEDK